MNLSNIKQHLMVYTKAQDNTPPVSIGRVEHIDGEKYIKLTQSHSSDGHHHWIPIDWVEFVDEQAVYLNKTQDQIITGLMVYHSNPSSR